MNIENIIVGRLQLQSTQRSLYDITKEDIVNLNEFKDFLKRRWNELDEFGQYSVIKTIGGNFYKTTEKYINSLTSNYELQ